VILSAQKAAREVLGSTLPYNSVRSFHANLTLTSGDENVGKVTPKSGFRENIDSCKLLKTLERFFRYWQNKAMDCQFMAFAINWHLSS